MVLARNHQIFQWVVILLNQLTALLSRQFTIIRWSISYTPNLSYRPHRGSHEVSKMDMERQAPDTKLHIYQTLALSVLLYATDT